MRLELNRREQELFAKLRKAGEQHGLVLRAAGGWVRDRLLHRDSHDIDICIDKCTGKVFVEQVLGMTPNVVAARPDQSKHLETAMVRIDGYAVDFVNLRDETGGGAYAADSRILTSNVFTTPEIDAKRRDFTVNALFYNLMTEEVEDFVGGLTDLGFNEKGELQDVDIVLRTPLDPLVTFADDPIRILRCLRFMCKLDAEIAPEVKHAMKNEHVQQMFRDKLSQERIAAELLGVGEASDTGNVGFKCGILNYNRETEALSILHDCGLLKIILDVPLMKDFASFDMDQNSKYHQFRVFDHTMMVMSALRQLDFVRWLGKNDLQRQSLLKFAALLHDLGKLDPNSRQLKDDGTYSYIGHEDVSAEVARDICNKLKLSNDATDYVVKVVKYHMDPHGKDWGDKDSTLRKFMRKLGNHWRDVIEHAYADCLGSGTPRKADELKRYGEKIERCVWLLENDPVSPHTVKPPLDGLIIMQEISELKPGPWMKHLIGRLVDIRMERPEASEEELIGKVREWKPEYLADPQYANLLKR